MEICFEILKKGKKTTRGKKNSSPLYKHINLLIFNIKKIQRTGKIVDTL